MNIISLLKVGFRRNFTYILLLCITLIILGGIISFWAYNNPVSDIETKTQTNYDYTLENNQTVEAVVNTSLYNSGETYTNISNYQIKAFPKLKTYYEINKQKGLEEDTKVIIKYVLEAERNGNVFWSEVYDSIEVKNSENHTINIHSVNQERNEILSEVGRSVSINFYKEISFMNEDNFLQQKKKDISINDGFYSIDRGEINFVSTEEVVVSNEESTSNYLYYGIILLSIGFILLIMIILCQIIKVTKDDKWRYNLYMNSEWYSKGYYENRNTKSKIKLSSFSEIRNVSQKIGKPIIYDQSKEILFIVDGETLYYVSKPNSDSLMINC